MATSRILISVMSHVHQVGPLSLSEHVSVPVLQVITKIICSRVSQIAAFVSNNVPSPCLVNFYMVIIPQVTAQITAVVAPMEILTLIYVWRFATVHHLGSPSLQEGLPKDCV